MKKSIIRVIGVIAIISGILLLAGSSITGFVIGEGTGVRTIFLTGLILVIAGYLITLQARKGGLEVLISRLAVERSERDPRVKQNLKRYVNEIERLKADPLARPQERIGEFSVSPRGRSPDGLRVAWHYDQQNNILYIDDLLYHEKENKYVGNWNKKAKERTLTKSDYAKSGYVAYSGV